MGFLDNVGSDEVLNADESLIFPEKSFIEFTCIDAKENAKNGDLILDCQVNSGEHSGKRHSIFISDRDHEIARKQKAQFLKAFWSIDQLKSGNISPADLVATEFTARAGKARTPEGSDMTFQGFTNFSKLSTGNDIGNDGANTVASPAPEGDIPFAPEPTMTEEGIA